MDNVTYSKLIFLHNNLVKLANHVTGNLKPMASDYFANQFIYYYMNNVVEQDIYNYSHQVANTIRNALSYAEDTYHVDYGFGDAKTGAPDAWRNRAWIENYKKGLTSNTLLKMIKYVDSKVVQIINSNHPDVKTKIYHK